MRWSSFATAALWSLLGVSVAYSQAFTYQGFLRVNGTPASGFFNMRFSLFTGATVGSPIGTVTLNNVSVANGLFTVPLNFGGLTLWDGTPRWLLIEVADPPNSTNYVPVLPRVEIRPTPYSFFAYQSPWSGLIGVPAGFADGIDNDTTYSAGAGLQLTGTTFSIAPNGVVTSMIADNAVTNAKIVSVDWSKITNAPAFLTSVSAQSPLTGNGTAANPLRLINGTAAGQILKWSGTGWTLATDNDTTYSAGAGLQLTGTTFSIAPNGVVTSMIADGAVTDAKLSATGVTAGTYGSATQVPRFTVNSQGRITSATNVSISGVPPGGPAGGDLSGNYPNPIVVRIQGFPVSSTGPQPGQVLRWAGGQWTPADERWLLAGADAILYRILSGNHLVYLARRSDFFPSFPDGCKLYVTSGPVDSSPINNQTVMVVSKGGEPNPSTPAGYFADWPSGWAGGIGTWDIASASIRASTFNTRSDRRLKIDIQPLNPLDDYDRLLKLRPVSFRWRPELQLGQSRHFGFIAQEVAEVFPEMVLTGGRVLDVDDVMGINLELDAQLVNALQVQHQMIVQQAQEIEQLRAELRALRALIQQQANHPGAK